MTYKFSIIMAVYNSENYIYESINSVVNQSIGFEDNIQLILVDDGSSDDSKKILSEFQEKYPNNIQVILQDHQGPARARNNALEYVEGEYVNFLDSDDYLSLNALEEVHNFFSENDVNLLALPLKLFEKEEKDDLLNYKFIENTVINLENNPNNPQESISSLFIRKDLIKDKSFNTDLISSEDVLFINELLLKEKEYAVINTAEYHYRKRYDLSDLTSYLPFEKRFYTERLRNFHLKLIEESLTLENDIPLFIQYNIIYNLQYIINLSELDMFDSIEEKEEFITTLKEVLSYVDSEVIIDNNNILNNTLRNYILYLKTGKISKEQNNNDIVLKIDEKELTRLTSTNFVLKHIVFINNSLTISGDIYTYFDEEEFSVDCLNDDNEKYDVKLISDVNKDVKFLSESFIYYYKFIVSIPWKIPSKSEIRFKLNCNDEEGNNLASSQAKIVLPKISEFSKNRKYIFDSQIMNINDDSIKIDIEPEFKFKFSVVMAIYNTEEYLEEAIESVINQTIGFEENIQLILVDDGSIDNSSKIIEEYREKYPDNIVSVYQENAGQASARNNGLNYTQGRYINFLDSDDYWSIDTFEHVYEFFENHKSEIDLVALPIIEFGRKQKNHVLNRKFTKNKVINLRSAPNNPQLHISSTFIKKELLEKFNFDTTLVSSEDTLLVNQILLEKKRYGILKFVFYYYRQREDFSSTIDTVAQKKEYYTDRLKNHFMRIIDYSIEKEGRVPDFIQYMLAYNLQWMINKDLDSMDNNIEIKEFWYYLYNVIEHIEEKKIRKNKYIRSQLNRDFFLYLKNKELKTVLKNETVMLYIGDKAVDQLHYHKIWLDIVELDKEVLNISGFFNSLFDSDYISVEAIKTNDDGNVEKILAKNAFYTSRMNKTFLSKTWQFFYSFDIKIPFNSNENSTIGLKVNYHKDGDNTNFVEENLLSFDLSLNFRKNAKISPESHYIVNDSNILLFTNNQFNIMPYSYKKMLRFEGSSIKKLLSDKLYGYRKAVLLRTLYLLTFPYMRRRNNEIYLFMDRVEHADDNAEHLFKYANKQNDGIDKYFVIDKKSDDKSRLSKIGKVLNYNSLKHNFLYLYADKIISSHPDEVTLDPFFEYKNSEINRYASLMTAKRYYIRHGVTKDNMSTWLHKFDKNLALLLTSSDLERESFLEPGYNFDEEIIQALGLPRYDNLNKEDTKKQVLILPTWRNYLKTKEMFVNSDYYNNLNNLLNNEKIIELLDKKGYQLIFKAHPKLERIADEEGNTFLDLLKINDKIKISTKEGFQELFNKSALLITDYSSVFFDFAYLKKPVIYYQHDDDYHFEEGYFSYQEMGFGEVLHEEDELIKKMEYYLENGCNMEEKYKERVDKFFKYTDKNNCKRVYEWIKNN